MAIDVRRRRRAVKSAYIHICPDLLLFVLRLSVIVNLHTTFSRMRLEIFQTPRIGFRPNSKPGPVCMCAHLPIIFVPNSRAFA